MHHHRLRLPGAPWLRHVSLYAAALLAPLCAQRPDADAGSPDLHALWNDPTFQKQFIGTYGINAEIEPRVSADEVKILEKVRPLLAEDNLAGAQAMLERHIRPESSAILDFNLGNIKYQQERMAEALASYQNAVAKFPSFRRAYRNVGLIQARNGEYDAAIKAFTRMIELGGGDAFSYGLLGVAYAFKQDYQAAEAAYRNALLLQPDSTEWRLGLTRCVYKQQKFADAASLLDTLIEQYPDKTDFWLLQAHTYLGMKLPLKAAENLEALHLLGKSTADSLNLLGEIYVSESLMDLAASAYVRAIEVDANQPPARALRAVEAMAARGAVAPAKDLAQNTRRLLAARMQDADRRKLLRLEARLSLNDSGSNVETARVLEELVQADPLDGEALMLLGQHYAVHGEPDRAILCYERAAGIDAHEVNARVRHGQILVGMNRFGEAVPLLRRAQEVKPRDDIARYLEQVERLAKSRR